MRQCQARIDVERLSHTFLRLAVLVPGKLVKMPDTAHAMIESVEVGRIFAGSARTLCQQHLRLDGSDHVLCNLVLQCENIREVAVKAFSPKMVSSLGVNQLGGCTDSIRRFSNAAFEHVADAQFAAICFTSRARPL